MWFFPPTDLIGWYSSAKLNIFLFRITPWPSSAAPPSDPTSETHLLTHNLLPTLNPTQMSVSDVATLADPLRFLSCTSLHFNCHLLFFCFFIVFLFFFAFAWSYSTEPTLLLMDVLHASLVVLILRLAVKIIREKRNSFFPHSQPLQHTVVPFVCCRRRCRVGLCSTETAKPLEILSVIVGVSLWQRVLAAEVSTQLQFCIFFFCTSSFWTIFSIGVAIGRKTQCVLLTFFRQAELSKELQLNPQTLWIDKQQVIVTFFLLFFFPPAQLTLCFNESP